MPTSHQNGSKWCSQIDHTLSPETTTRPLDTVLWNVLSVAPASYSRNSLHQAAYRRGVSRKRSSDGSRFSATSNSSQTLIKRVLSIALFECIEPSAIDHFHFFDRAGRAAVPLSDSEPSGVGAFIQIPSLPILTEFGPTGWCLTDLNRGDLRPEPLRLTEQVLRKVLCRRWKWKNII